MLTSKVLGIDINAAMQPEEVPDNLYLQVDDLNRRYKRPPQPNIVKLTSVDSPFQLITSIL